jgi:5S rRNA maturation endonuclease (ribonuclease M5)
MNIDDLYQEMENVKDTAVLVEGPNDKKALEKLGFSNVVFMNRAMYKIVEQLEEEEEILLLTDLDQHGKGLYKYFYQEFTRRGVRVNNRLRILLLQTPVKHIEGLAHYIEKKEHELLMTAA